MSVKVLHIDSNHPILWQQLEEAGFENHADFKSSKEEIEAKIGCDKLIYQDLDEMRAAINKLNTDIKGFEASCFDGQYITGDISDSLVNP